MWLGGKTDVIYPDLFLFSFICSDGDNFEIPVSAQKRINGMKVSTDELLYLATNADRTSYDKVHAEFMMIAFDKASNLKTIPNREI